MSESLFTVQTPVATDAADGGAAGITTATGLFFDVAGLVTGVRFYATATTNAGETYTAELWELTTASTGTRLAAKAVSGAGITPGGWNEIAFDTPVAVDADTAYRVAVNSSGGRYVATLNFFGSAALTNGHITAWQDGTNPTGLGATDNGTFAANSPANTYPDVESNQASYFADVLFTPAGGPPVNPTVAAQLAALESLANVTKSKRALAAPQLAGVAGAVTITRRRNPVVAAQLAGLETFVSVGGDPVPSNITPAAGTVTTMTPAAGVTTAIVPGSLL